MKYFIPPYPAFTMRGQFVRLLMRRNICRMPREYFVLLVFLIVYCAAFVVVVTDWLGVHGTLLQWAFGLAGAFLGWWISPIAALHWGEPDRLRGFPKGNGLSRSAARQMMALRYKAGVLILSMEQGSGASVDAEQVEASLTEYYRQAMRIIEDDTAPVGQLGS